MIIEPANSVVLVVGRDQYTPPRSLDGEACSATDDCIAVGVVSVDDRPTHVRFGDASTIESLLMLGRFPIPSDGTISIRDIHGREYLNIETRPGVTSVTIWGNDTSEPSQIVVQPG
jgi:hypothetical protein